MVPKPATMASGVAISVPEMLHGEDARSWFKRFEVCAAANEWGAEKKLTRVPTLLKGRAWAVYEALTEEETDTYAHLKAALLAQLSPDMDEERLRARDELARRRLREDVESIDELARDLEKLLERASPDLPQATKSTELRFHLINALPEKISFQLKLLPKENYRETISKAKELVLMYHRAEKTEETSQLVSIPSQDRLTQLEEAVKQVSQQMAMLGTNNSTPAGCRCFTCGRLGHIARNCSPRRSREIECFTCGKKGHLARNCWQQGNDQGNAFTRRAGGTPMHH